MYSENQFNREIFSTEIARVNLNPPKKNKDEMITYFREITELQKKHKTSTGDVTGSGALHLKPEFNWLTKKVEEQVIIYLENLGVKLDSLSLFHEKSWPVINQDGGEINTHYHPNALISVVYYLNTESDKGGNLLFSRETPLFSGSIKGLSFLTKKSKYTYGIKPKNNMLVIFPSNTVHEVLKYEGNSPRWSVTYDIIATSKSNLGAGKTENTIIHPIFWKEFKDRFSKNSVVPSSIIKEPIDDYFFKNKSNINNSFCIAVFTELVSKWNTIDPTLLNAEKLVQTTSLDLSDSVIALLNKLINNYKDKILERYKDYQEFYLSELVSICSFPGSEKFSLKRINKNKEQHLSFCVNLLTSDNSNSFQLKVENNQKNEPINIDLTSVSGDNFMIRDIDYQLNLSPNKSSNGIVPLFLVSFDKDLKNKENKKIKKEYIGKYYLKDFL